MSDRPEGVNELADRVWPASRRQSAVRVERDGGRAVELEIAEEVPVALVYNGTSHAVMIATPGDLEDLAVGFSLSEGIVETASELLDLETRQAGAGIEVSMRLTQRRFAALAERRRTLAGRTGCGLCGVDSLAQVVRPVGVVGAGAPTTAAAIWQALAALRQHQPLNRATGSMHAAAFAAPDGRLELVREDIGRHNALDKLLGALTRQGRDPAQGFVVLTSRCSFEMVQKAATCGVAILVAISAPTALALDLAERCGVTIVALARTDSMILHSHPRRIATTS